MPLRPATAVARRVSVHRVPVRRRAGLAGSLLAVFVWLTIPLAVAGGVSPAAEAAQAATPAATPAAMAAQILSLVNRDRVALGLRPLWLDDRLATIAGLRASDMAALGSLSHAVGGSVDGDLTAAGIQWWSEGEDIGYTTYPWGSTSAARLYELWKASPPHWAILTSATYNYVGVGVAARAADASTWGSLIVTESADHTPPVARIASRWRSGASIGWRWLGSDPALQTHTAGLRSFDVQYRIDGGTWRTIRAGTTTTALTLGGRPRGHAYALRVRARDWLGNLSAWSAGSTIIVP